MEKYKIERNIPRPARLTSGRKPQMPFADLQLGESFFVPFTDYTTSSIRQYAVSFGKASGLRFAVDQLSGGTRVWRL